MALFMPSTRARVQAVTEAAWPMWSITRTTPRPRRRWPSTQPLRITHLAAAGARPEPKERTE